MDNKLIDRIFVEMDCNSKGLVELSKVVHSNAAILGIIAKLVVAIILFITVTCIGAMYKYAKDSPTVHSKPYVIEKTEQQRTYKIRKENS